MTPPATISMKELLLVSLGSFFGGGARYLVSKAVQSCVLISFPFGTLVVNVVGCLIIGFLFGLPWQSAAQGSPTSALSFPQTWLTPSTRLLLTTGFCGGFTTFSTFMSESATLLKDGHELLMALYIVASLILGFAAVVLGQWLAKTLSA